MGDLSLLREQKVKFNSLYTVKVRALTMELDKE